MAARRSLTVYQLRHRAVRSFDDAVREELRKTCQRYERGFDEYEMRLYLPESRRAAPHWQDLIDEFVDGRKLASVSNRALIPRAVQVLPRDAIYGICFRTWSPHARIRCDRSRIRPTSSSQRHVPRRWRCPGSRLESDMWMPRRWPRRRCARADRRVTTWNSSSLALM